MTNSIDPRYPIGDFSFDGISTPESRATRIATLRELPGRLREAVAGLSETQLDTPYRDGGWTVRQVVHHVADSHANAYIRVKLALTEDWPTIKPYDEAAWAELADARTLPVEFSLEMLAVMHARWICVLEAMSEADFRRGYVHPGMKRDGGRQSLDEVIAMYAWHSRHHTAHILNLRERTGW
jgi:DinB superfamily